MQDRVPVYPGRVVLTPVAGQTNTYDMVRADQPTQEGTPLKKSTLLSDETAQAMGLDPANNPTPNDAFGTLTVKRVNITLYAASWVEGEKFFTQEVAVEGVTAHSRVDIVLNADQLDALLEDGLAFILMENEGGVCTAKTRGAAPSADMTVEVDITEVSV